jgi:hypothetical protein
MIVFNASAHGQTAAKASVKVAPLSMLTGVSIRFAATAGLNNEAGLADVP